jgi:periplasmic copper chaperone A
MLRHPNIKIPSIARSNIMFKHITAALFLFIATSASAYEYKVSEITIGHPWARGAGAIGAGYLKLDNKGAADKLISASSDVSKSVELHSHVDDKGVMRMRKVDAIDVPASGVTELKPGGFHVMFIGLKEPLKEGARFPVTLKFERAGEVKVEFKVEPAGKDMSEHKY